LLVSFPRILELVMAFPENAVFLKTK